MQFHKIISILNIKSFEKDASSAEYDGHSFIYKNNFIAFRSAKITPIKLGGFVAFYKKGENGKITPFGLGLEKSLVLLIVAIQKNTNFGYFLFSQKILQKQKIICECDGTGGKLAFRVYAPWDEVSSPQALKTKKWQSECFFPDLSNELMNQFIL